MGWVFSPMPQTDDATEDELYLNNPDDGTPHYFADPEDTSLCGQAEADDPDDLLNVGPVSDVTPVDEACGSCENAIESHQPDDADPATATDGGTDGDDGDEDTTDTEPQAEIGMKAIVEARYLNDYLGHLNALVEEAKIHLSRDGWRTTAVDPANVGMVDIQLDTGAFESWDGPRAEETIGINLSRLSDVLKAADSDQLVELVYNARVRNLSVRYGGHEWTLSLIDPASIRQEPDIPDLDLPVEATFDARVFKTGTKHADMVSDHLMVQTVPGEPNMESEPDVTQFILKAEGDVDEYVGRWNHGEEVAFQSQPTESPYSLYSLDYLKDMMQPFGVDDKLTIRHGDEYPLKIKSKIYVDGDDENSEIGSVTNMLAPRIQSE